MKLFAAFLLLTLSAALPVAEPALAQDYPNRPVKFVLGFVPGGGVDTMLRKLCVKLAEGFGQPCIVENKPGASGLIAADFVANAQPDGYTLLLGETSQIEAAPAGSRIKDMVPVALVTTTTLILVANPKTGIRSLDDLMRTAKAQPGKLTIGTSGTGSIHHLATASFQHGAGIDLTHVPYKGSGQSIHAVLSGEVDLAMTSMTAAQGHIATGSLNLLATTSETRLTNHPGTPAISAAVPGYSFSIENGVLGPPGLPPAIAAKVSEAIRDAIVTRDFVALVEGAPGTVNSWQSPARYAQTIVASRSIFAQALKLAGQPSN